MAGITLVISFPPLPEGWRGSPDDFLQMIASTIIFDATGDFLTGQVGGAEPTSDVGIWVDGTTIKVWNEEAGKYVPTETVPVGAVLPYFGATPPDSYLFCDGAEYGKGDENYAGLYAVIGDLHKHGDDDEDKFRVPDLRGRGLTGAGTGEYGPLDGLPDGNMKPLELGDYLGQEWPVPRETASAGAPSVKSYLTPVPSTSPYQKARSFYTNARTPTAVCNWIIRYR